MENRNHWTSVALCKKDDQPSLWLSSNIDDVNYAKNVCRKCTVRMECLLSVVYEKDDFIGIHGGLSEIEYLLLTWKEVDDEQDTNWDITDSVVQRLLREIA